MNHCWAVALILFSEASLCACPHILANLEVHRVPFSLSFALAGCRSRALLICRFTRPRVHIVPQLEDLTQLYLQHGHALHMLWSTLEKLLRRFKLLGQWHSRAIHLAESIQRDH